MKTLIALATSLVVASAVSSQGQNIDWNLTGSAGFGSTNGNTLSFTQDGVEVTAGAWGYTKGSDDTAFESAKLGQFSTGLGSVNRDEGSSDPSHRLDNLTQNDYILFVFDELVDVSSIRVSPGGNDTDASYWLGNVDENVSLSDVSYSGLSALGFGSEKNYLGNSSNSSVSIAIDSPSSGINAILFGAHNLETLPWSNNKTDAFKVKSIQASTVVIIVPEPSTALLSLLGMVGFCFRRRR